MAKDLFYSLDLNLLRTFLVLSQELNMRKASQRLFVSQPAISQALQKLRNHFDDELFVKVPSGLEATSFALELAESIAPHLDGLANALNASQEFEPSQLESKIKIALSPMVLGCLSGTLFHQLRKQAPLADIELVGWTHTTLDEIGKGETLIGVNYDLDAPKGISLNHLIDLKGRVFVRQGHPIKKSIAEPKDFDGYEIASFINPGWNDQYSVAEQIMKSLGFTTRVGFRSEMIVAIIDVVQHTDMFMPHSNLFPIDQYPNLRAIDIKIAESTKTMSVYSQYHLKNRNNPLIHWLNNEIQTALEYQANKIDSILAI
ncbi:LysR family transcriptional regulator [Vibrio europaeus]|uniref:LysR family transcriptional regulator n=1 Tax=Vibrio europaeus TaxID=300876 RepID=A0A178JDM0_9VIBR|nr:LysR family transcriptional regulator [Vibrio europaeus]MDC5703383.1 LysR family transcriptional regulator [Vibrio europaeus]MDC5711462.1 LysR family transcriptional regulator [Vibrio europaeus]MDC5714955.1 LysR family transcriptional regulator [Vibrio europaeus]MDC5722107.1 LysR family transcriptional regulator [Vibrio europaeus]MDC5727573.1 LysR family transcriptional regulator [Vibrio europaeus]